MADIGGRNEETSWRYSQWESQWELSISLQEDSTWRGEWGWQAGGGLAGYICMILWLLSLDQDYGHSQHTFIMLSSVYTPHTTHHTPPHHTTPHHHTPHHDTHCYNAMMLGCVPTTNHSLNTAHNNILPASSVFNLHHWHLKTWSTAPFWDKVR